MYATPTIIRKVMIVPAARIKKNGALSGGGAGFSVRCGDGEIVGKGE